MTEPSKPILIFDFDGTIADSFGEFAKIFSTVSPKGDLRPEDLEYLRGLSAQQIIKYLNIPFWRIPHMLSVGRQEFSKVISQVSMFAGLPEVLAELYAQGYTMYVVSSNGTQNIQDFLTAHRSLDYFRQVIGGVGIFSKAGAIKKIKKAHHTPAAHYMLIGDEVRDIEVAKKLGIPCIAVTYGYNTEAVLAAHSPDFLVHAPADLMTCFGREVSTLR